MTPLEAALRAILPSSVSVAFRDPARLWPMTDAEAHSIAKAVPKRRAEFSAGRDAARACLQDLRSDSCEIGRDGRAPVWPRGFTGSITHTDSACLAVVAATDRIGAIGVDLERAEALPKDLVPIVLRADDSCAARIGFSIKEAVYKMLSARLPFVLDFHDVNVTQQSDALYRASLTRPAGPWVNGSDFVVHVVPVEGHILSVCWLDAGDMP